MSALRSIKYRSTRKRKFEVYPPPLRQLQEKSREHRTPIYMAFIDLTKAFNTVSRPALWVVLEKIGLPWQMRKIIRSFKNGMLAQIIHGGNISEAFSVYNGTFALYFAVMLRQALEGKGYGIPVFLRVSGGLFNICRFTAKTKTTIELICDLLYADDCALVAQSAQELQLTIDWIHSLIVFILSSLQRLWSYYKHREDWDCLSTCSSHRQ